jgi:hypothetical protein
LLFQKKKCLFQWINYWKEEKDKFLQSKSVSKWIFLILTKKLKNLWTRIRHIMNKCLRKNFKKTVKLPIMSTSLKWALLVGSDSVHIREVLLYILQTELCVSLTKSHLWDEMNKISFTFDKILHKFRCFYYVHK